MIHREPRSEFLQSLFHELNDTVVVIEAETARVVQVNRKACEVLGYTEDELLNMRVWDIQEIFSNRSRWQDFRKQMQEKGSRVVEGSHRRKDGSCFPVEVNIREVSSPEGVHYVAVARDITKRKQAEEALATSEALYRTLLENVPPIIWQAEADGYVNFVNKTWTEITGMPLEDALGSGWAKVIHPETLQPY